MIEVGTRLVKCTPTGTMGNSHNVVMGDIFLVLEVHKRFTGPPAVRVHSERLGRILLMYTHKHFIRSDGTYSIYKSCIWEVL